MKAHMAGPLAGVLVGSVIVLAGCTAAESQDNHAASAEIDHIHALSTTTDGVLLIGSHNGIYQVDYSGDDSAATGPVGGANFDSMGFVATDRVWYTSGHPGPESPEIFAAPNIGLLKSTDEGQTWTSVSLSGEADFHSLTASTGDVERIYGLRTDAQEIQVSRDGGTTWQAGASLMARMLLADENPDIVYATTDRGFAVSTDAGASFEVQEDAPPLLLVAADPSRGGNLVGIDTTGTIWQQQGDLSWVSGGTVEGVAQALTVDPDGTIVLALEHAILSSTDYGQSWKTLVEIE